MLAKSKRIVDSAARKRAKQGWCELCGYPHNIEIHHIIPKGANGPDIEENLVSLCHACHRKVHDGNIQRQILWSLVARRLQRDSEEIEQAVITIKNGVIGLDDRVLQ